jgi:hypothetical protein
MRVTVLALMTLTLVGAAAAQPAPADDVRILSPAEVVAALETPALCLNDALTTGACDDVAEVMSASEARLSFRDSSVMDLKEFSDPAAARFYREIATVARYDALFVTLEAQRSAGDFRYLRFAEVLNSELSESTGRWCDVREEDYNLANLQAGFVRDLNADSEVTPLEPEVMQQFRNFMRDLISDPVIVEMSAADQELSVLRDSLMGVNHACATYFGTGPADRPTITRREFHGEDGARMALIDDYVTAHAARTGLQFRPS